MKRTVLIVISVLLALLLVSCASSKDFQRLKEATQSAIDALIADDKEALRAVISEDISDKELEAEYPALVKCVAGIEEYTLKQTSWYTQLDNGVKYVKATYSMTAGDIEYEISVVARKGSDKLSGFHINIPSNTEQSESQKDEL